MSVSNVPFTTHLSNKHSWSCPVKRPRFSGAGRARVAISGAPSGAERPMSNTPAKPNKLEIGNVGMCCVFERLGQKISSALEEPIGFERVRTVIHFEHPSGAERARTHMSSTLRARMGSNSETSTIAIFSSSQAKQFRVPLKRRANSSRHFERPSGDEWARTAMSSAPKGPSVLEVANVVSCNISEQPGRAISSVLAEPSEFERLFRAPHEVSGGFTSRDHEGNPWVKRYLHAKKNYDV